MLYISNIFAANAVKSTTDSIWTNLTDKCISSVVVALNHTYFLKITKAVVPMFQISIITYSVMLTEMSTGC